MEFLQSHTFLCVFHTILRWFFLRAAGFFFKISVICSFLRVHNGGGGSSGSGGGGSGGPEMIEDLLFGEERRAMPLGI